MVFNIAINASLTLLFEEKASDITDTLINNSLNGILFLLTSTLYVLGWEYDVDDAKLSNSGLYLFLLFELTIVS